MSHQFLNEGTYGCGFRPVLPCKNENAFKNSINYEKLPFIGKVFRDVKSMTKEKDIYTSKIQIVNADSKFTTKMKGSCIVDLAKLKLEDISEISKCKHIKKSNPSYPTFHQLILEDGGRDLSDWSHEIPFMNYFVHMKPLFYGLEKMGKEQICHQDIKKENVVYNPNTNRMLYIDFGFTQKFEELYRLQNLFLHDSPYISYPPEYLLYGMCVETVKYGQTNPFFPYFFKERQSEFNKKIHKSLKIMASDAKTIFPQGIPKPIKLFFDNLDPAYRLPFVFDTINKYEQDYHALPTFMRVEDRLHKVFAQNAHKVDTFSLGATLLDCIRTCMRETYVLKMTQIKKANERTKVMGMNHASSSFEVDNISSNSDPFYGVTNTDLLQWETYKNVYPSIFDLISKMIHPDPAKRATPSEAHHHYNSILEMFSYVNPPNNGLNKLQKAVNIQSGNGEPRNNINTRNFRPSEILKERKEQLLKALLFPQLKSLAKQMRIPNYSTLNKKELYNAIIKNHQRLEIDMIPIHIPCEKNKVRDFQTGRCIKKK